MNSDLTPAQNVSGTDNPQTSQNSMNGASTASDFQQAAGLDVLSQNTSLSVDQTGTPNEPAPSPDTMNGAAVVILVVGLVLVLLAAYAVFRWVMHRPEKVEIVKEVSKKPSSETLVEIEKNTKVSSKKSKPKTKKKQPRRKRRK